MTMSSTMRKNKTYEGFKYIDYKGSVERFEVNYSVEWKVFGRHIPATRTSPEEFPDVELQGDPVVVSIMDYEDVHETKFGNKPKEVTDPVLIEEVTKLFMKVFDEAKCRQEIEGNEGGKND